MLNKLSVLVMSCDAYSDVWTGFSVCWKTNWPDCPYPVYLCAETTACPKDMVFEQMINSPQAYWSDRLLYALKQIDSQYVLLVLDDIWLVEPIKMEDIENCINALSQNSVGTTRLFCPHNKKLPIYEGNDAFVTIPFGQPYRINTTPAIWDVDFLQSILLPGESAWEFERLGSYRDAGNEKMVLGARHPIYRYLGDLGAIEQGKYERFTPQFAELHNIPLDRQRRAVKSHKDVFLKNMKSCVYNLNPNLVVRVQNILHEWRKIIR